MINPYKAKAKLFNTLTLVLLGFLLGSIAILGAIGALDVPVFIGLVSLLAIATATSSIMFLVMNRRRSFWEKLKDRVNDPAVRKFRDKFYKKFGGLSDSARPSTKELNEHLEKVRRLAGITEEEMDLGLVDSHPRPGRYPSKDFLEGIEREVRDPWKGCEPKSWTVLKDKYGRQAVVDPMATIQNEDGTHSHVTADGTNVKIAAGGKITVNGVDVTQEVVYQSDLQREERERVEREVVDNLMRDENLPNLDEVVDQLQKKLAHLFGEKPNIQNRERGIGGMLESLNRATEQIRGGLNDAKDAVTKKYGLNKKDGGVRVRKEKNGSVSIEAEGDLELGDIDLRAPVEDKKPSTKCKKNDLLDNPFLD